MPIEVDLPDGSVAEFPDGTSHEVMKSAIQKRFKPETTGEFFKGWYRAGLQGPLMGFADETEAVLRSKNTPQLSGFPGLLQTGAKLLAGEAESYDKALEETRGEQKKFDERNPYLSVGTELVTGLATPIAGFGQMARAPANANRLQRVVQSRPGRAALMGSTYGTVGGVGHSEGGVGNRVEGGALGGAIGGVAGPLLSEVVIPVGARMYGGARDAVRYGNRAVRSYQNPEQVAIENVADKMVAAGLDPAVARAQVSPATSANLQRRGFSEENIADIVSRGLRGEPAAQIGQDYGINASTVNRYVNSYRQSNPTPMNIIDISKEVQGEGASAPLWRLGRAANSLAGDDAADAVQALMARQEGQAGRVTGMARRATGGNDYEQTLQAGQQRLRTEADQAYSQFYQEPDLAINQLADLMDDPVFQQATKDAIQRARVEAIKNNQKAARSGKPSEPLPYLNKNDPQIRILQKEVRSIQDDLRAARRRRQDAKSKSERELALDEIRAHEDNLTYIQREINDLKNDNPEVFSPYMLDQIQRELRIASEGKLSNPNVANHARNLRQVFLDRIEDHYPTFQGIRQQYAQGLGEFGEEGALQAGRDLTLRLGERADEALRGFEQMTPAQQELFRLGFARNIQDMAANPQIGGAVANRFNTNAVREIVTRLFRGDADLVREGQRLLRDLRREAITTKTKNDLTAGARTAELENDMGNLMQTAQAGADIATGNFRNILQNLSTRLSTQLGRRGAAETLRILTETDPARLLPLLNRLARAAPTPQQRQAYVTTIRQIRALSPTVSGMVGREAGIFTGQDSGQ